jgi:hypothetical protein
MLAAALDYANGPIFGRAVAIFPLAPHGKLPLIRKDKGGRGYLDATADLEQITEWWSETPDANIGLPMNPNGLVGVDLDGDLGLDTWANLGGREGSDHPGPLSCCTETGGGGHIIYALPEGRKGRNSVKGLPGIDLRGPGYLVVPPSVHPNGTTYRWVMPPWRLAPQLAPDWVLEPHKRRLSIVPRYAETDGHSRYGRAALIGTPDRPGLLDEVAGARHGTRNGTLYRAARRVLDLVDSRDLEPGNAWHVLTLAAFACGLLEREILITLASAREGHHGA